MFWMVFDNIILIYETGILFYLAKQFFTTYRKEKFRVPAYIVSVLILHRGIAVVFAEHLTLTALCSGLIDYLLFGLLCPKQWRKRLFTIFFYYVLMISLDLLLIFVFPVRPDDPHLELYHFLGIIVSRSLLLFVLQLALVMGGKNTIPGNHFMIVAPLPALISIALLVSLYGYEVYEVVFNRQLGITVAMILLVVLILLFVYIQLMRNEEALQEQLQTQKLLRREQAKYCDALLKNYYTIRSARHDLHHYLGTVSVLIQSGQYEPALEICGSAWRQLGSSFIYTGNEIVDAVLYSKQALFHQAEAVLIVEGCLPPNPGYDGADICVILSNALENALEAVIKLPVDDRIVNVRFIFNNWLLIIVENKITELPVNNHGRFHSRKPGRDHGIGIESITAACKRQNGYMEITIKDGKFILSATLQPKI